jgi:Uncharacterized conserved protein
MKLAVTVIGPAALGLVLLVGCSTNVREAAPGESATAPAEEARNVVRSMARDTLSDLYASQPAAKQAVENAAGHAVFSNFGMKILVAGGGTGKGVAVNNKTGKEVFMRMAEVQAGIGFGVKKFRQVWVFQDQAAFEKFVNSGFEFGGQATLAAKASGEGLDLAGAVSVSPGVWLYQLTDEGLAAELTVKGTKYYPDAELN